MATRRCEPLPGIGERLAGSIQEIATTGHLGLEDKLESEVWPGKLFTEVPGIGEGTGEAHPRSAWHQHASADRRGVPHEGRERSVEEDRAEAVQSDGEAWLPVLRAKRQGWNFTVLFSNTALAHRSGKNSRLGRDLLREGRRAAAVHRRDGRARETEGKHVVRGRERECREYYGV